MSMAPCAFPSPCGEKVGINDELDDHHNLNSWLYWFPSPCGEKVGINFHGSSPSSWVSKGFPSPCGEKVGINPGHVFQAPRTWSLVSVPLRGKGRDQHLSDPELAAKLTALFPSPCGEKVGINTEAGFHSSWIPWCFRPLAGKR